MSETLEKDPLMEVPEPAFGSNAIRLSAKQWVVAFLLIIAILAALPKLWMGVEIFEPGENYRTPYSLSNDYWQYARYAGMAARENKVLVIGDSVVWGEYVAPDGTLIKYLNDAVGKEQFLNLGINGIHPVALAGLIKYYGRAIRNQDVVIHYNPLWMTSPQHDLQSDKETRFNHPRLVPQYTTRIPCYKEPYGKRIGIVAERYMPFRGWTNHLATVYFDNTDFASWARENPYGNPFQEISLELPKPETALRHQPGPWHERGIKEQNFEWMLPNVSLQWRFFKETVQTLQARNNYVFVIVGPFNEHLMTEECNKTYQVIKADIDSWLKKQGVPYYMAELLPSDVYADASHPDAEGYFLLAKDLLANQDFIAFAKTS